MHREFKTYGFEQLLLSSVHSVQYLMVNDKRDLRKVMLISTHTCPSLALQVPSFLCPFPHHTKDTLKHSHLLKTTNVLTGVLPPLSTTIPDFKTSLQEIPSPVQKAPPPAIQRAVGASLTHPARHLTCSSRSGTEKCRPSSHLRGSDGRRPICCTAMVLNLPVLQEPPCCPELLQPQRIKLVPSLLSAYPAKELLNPRGAEEMNSPELLERVITPIMRQTGNKHFPSHVAKRPTPVAISASRKPVHSTVSLSKRSPERIYNIKSTSCLQKAKQVVVTLQKTVTLGHGLQKWPLLFQPSYRCHITSVTTSWLKQECCSTGKSFWR